MELLIIVLFLGLVYIFGVGGIVLIGQVIGFIGMLLIMYFIFTLILSPVQSAIVIALAALYFIAKEKGWLKKLKSGTPSGI